MPAQITLATIRCRCIMDVYLRRSTGMRPPEPGSGMGAAEGFSRAGSTKLLGCRLRAATYCTLRVLPVPSRAAHHAWPWEDSCHANL